MSLEELASLQWVKTSEFFPEVGREVLVWKHDGISYGETVWVGEDPGEPCFMVNSQPFKFAETIYWMYVVTPSRSSQLVHKHSVQSAQKALDLAAKHIVEEYAGDGKIKYFTKSARERVAEAIRNLDINNL